MSENSPAPTRNAEPIAKLATGVGTALAAIWFPPAALAQPVIDRLIEKYIRKPERMLIQAVREKGISAIQDEQVEQFVPMAYRFFEAAKQGEFEKNLRILSEFVGSELKQPVPDAGNFARISRRLESISGTELRVMLLAHNAMKQVEEGPDFNSNPLAKAFVESKFLAEHQLNTLQLDRWQIRLALADLASRGFLIPTGHAGFDKFEEHYYGTEALEEIIHKASESLN